MASVFIEGAVLAIPQAVVEAPRATDVTGRGYAARDRELCAIAQLFVSRLMADGGMLARVDAEGELEVLAIAGPLMNNPGLLDSVAECTRVVAQATERRAGGDPPIAWSTCDIGGLQGRLMLTQIALGRDEQVILSVIYANGMPIATERADEITAQIHPIATVALRLWAKSARERRRMAALEAALDMSGVAVAVLDRTGSVRHLNAAMRRITSAGDGLRVHGTTLVASDLPSAVRLHVAVQHSVAQALDGTGHDRRALMLTCKRPRATHGLPIAVSAVHRASLDSDGPTVVVHAIEPDADLAHLVRPLCELYGLSPVETTLALQLVSGQTLSDAAKTMRVKPQTARSYLKQVFAKTETNRQADLVRLLLASLLRLESPMMTLPA